MLLNIKWERDSLTSYNSAYNSLDYHDCYTMLIPHKLWTIPFGCYGKNEKISQRFYLVSLRNERKKERQGR